MKPSTPIAVARYLRSLSDEYHSYAYLGLSDSNKVRDCGGDLHVFGLAEIETDQSIFQQINLLEGLLPTGPTPLIITNAQFEEGSFVDLHLFTSPEGQWVLLLDNTEAGRRQQKNQQNRLEDDIIVEDRMKAKR